MRKSKYFYKFLLQRAVVRKGKRRVEYGIKIEKEWASEGELNR